MPLMTRIPSDLAKFGLTVELVPGWETRSAGSFNPGGVVCHWTAGPKASKSRPSLSVVVNGRAGLSGPLCNVYLARDGVCVVVAAGRANHAGEGGYKGMLGNSAVYGIEAECAGDGDWTPAQRKVYPILVAALLSGIERDASWACGHNEWAPTRKIDIRDWPMSAMRTQVASSLSNTDPSQEDDMFDDTDRESLYYVKGLLSWAFDPTLGTGPAFGQAGELTNTLRKLEYAAIPEDDVNSRGEGIKRLRTIQALVSDPATFAAALAPYLGDDVDQATVEAGVRAVLGSLGEA